MTERGRPVYCTQCGSIVEAGDNFCGVCGARVSPSARYAAPTQRIPTQVYAPRAAPTNGGGNRGLALALGLGAVLVVMLGIGAIVGLALLGGERQSQAGDSPRQVAAEEPPAQGQRNAGQENARQVGGGEPTETPRPEEEPLGVGDSVEVDGVAATLNEVRILPTTDFDQPLENPDNEFLATDLTFENVSGEPVAISSLLEFVLKNEEGYSASQTIHSQQQQLAEGEIAPGQKMSGEIVYEVPPESRGLQLDYRPFARGGTYTWLIGDLSGVAQAPEIGSTPTSPDPTTGPTESPDASETEVAEATEDYYQAVDREDWAYTYANLDYSTRALFTEEEWYAKNQYFADVEGLELASMDVVVNDPASAPEVGVTVYRTFKDGTSIDRYTLFVLEDGAWKHRFTEEEIGIFEPGVPYEEFVAGSNASPTADRSSNP